MTHISLFSQEHLFFMNFIALYCGSCIHLIATM